MKTNQVVEQPFQFIHRRPQNLLRVENHEAGVRVRAARDNFSVRDKVFFVRHLAAEGFIPEQYQWVSERGAGDLPGIDWCVDEPSRPGAGPGAPGMSPADRFMLRFLVAASVLWGLEITALCFLGH